MGDSTLVLVMGLQLGEYSIMVSIGEILSKIVSNMLRFDEIWLCSLFFFKVQNLVFLQEKKAVL